MSDPENHVDVGSPEVASNETGTILDEIDKCACGYDRHHYMVSAVPTYTAWGTFWITLMGVSAAPIRIDFRCRACGETFDFIRDEEELKGFL